MDVIYREIIRVVRSVDNVSSRVVDGSIHGKSQRRRSLVIELCSSMRFPFFFLCICIVY